MTADSLGGVWTYACEFAGVLAAYGVRISLAIMGGRVSDAKRRLAEDIPHLELHESPYRLEWMEGAEEDLERSSQWLLRLSRSVAPDLVHLNGYSHAALPWSAPVLVVGHSCVPTWWRAVHGASPPERYDEYVSRVRRALEVADAVVTPTLAHLEAMEREYGRIRRGRVVPNGRDPEAYLPATKHPYVLAVGRLWDEAKNITLLEEAASDLPWPVYVGGATRHPGEKPAPERTDGRRVPGVVALGELGPDELVPWYGSASIFALPARYEPFGLAPLEAALGGCALVLGDLPTLREVWGDAALFVRPDDRGALVAAIRRLTDEVSFRADMARRARVRALRFGPARMARGYAEVYGSLLEGESSFMERRAVVEVGRGGCTRAAAS